MTGNAMQDLCFDGAVVSVQRSPSTTSHDEDTSDSGDLSGPSLPDDWWSGQPPNGHSVKYAKTRLAELLRGVQDGDNARVHEIWDTVVGGGIDRMCAMSAVANFVDNDTGRTATKLAAMLFDCSQPDNANVSAAMAQCLYRTL